MENALSGLFKGFGFIGVVLLKLALMCLAPLIFLWTVNSLAELGGSDFYITHTVWSYWVVFVFLVVMKSSGSK